MTKTWTPSGGSKWTGVGDSMGKQQKVNWDNHNKQWIKTYQGKRYYLGVGSGKSDRDSRRLAIVRMDEIKKRVDAGLVVETAKDVPSPAREKEASKKNDISTTQGLKKMTKNQKKTKNHKKTKNQKKTHHEQENQKKRKNRH